MTFLTKFDGVPLVSEQILDLILLWHLVPVYFQSLCLYTYIMLHVADKSTLYSTYCGCGGICVYFWESSILPDILQKYVGKKYGKIISKLQTEKLPGHILFHMHIKFYQAVVFFSQWLSLWALFFNNTDTEHTYKSLVMWYSFLSLVFSIMCLIMHYFESLKKA